MSVGPGEDMEFLKREFQEFIKGIICIPIKFPGTRLYKSLQVNQHKLIQSTLVNSLLCMHDFGTVYYCDGFS